MAEVPASAMVRTWLNIVRPFTLLNRETSPVFEPARFVDVIGPVNTAPVNLANVVDAVVVERYAVVAITLPLESVARSEFVRFEIVSPCVVDVPITESAVAGVVVPIPTLPDCFITNVEVPDDEATLNGSYAPAVPCILKFIEDEVALIPCTSPLSNIVPEDRVEAEFQKAVLPFTAPEIPAGLEVAITLPLGSIARNAFERFDIVRP